MSMTTISEGFIYLRDWQDDVALEIWGILAHPIPVIFLWAFLQNFPGGWCCTFCWFLSWWYRPAWRNWCWSLWRAWRGRPANAFLAGHLFFWLSWKSSLVVWDIWQPSEGSDKAPKRIWELLVELMGELLIGGFSWLRNANRRGEYNSMIYETLTKKKKRRKMTSIWINEIKWD